MIMPADGMWEVTLAVTKTKPMGKAQGAESDSVTLSFGPDPKSLSLFTQILNDVNEDDGTYRHEIKYHFRGEKLAYQFDWHRTAHVKSEEDGSGADGGSGGGSRPTSRATRASSASTRATTADSTDDAEEEEEGQAGRPRTGASRGSRVMSAGSAGTTVSGHGAGLEFQVRMWVSHRLLDILSSSLTVTLTFTFTSTLTLTLTLTLGEYGGRAGQVRETRAGAIGDHAGLKPSGIIVR